MKNLKDTSIARVVSNTSVWPASSKEDTAVIAEPATIRPATQRERKNWDQEVSRAYGSCHFTQSLAWSEVKKAQGWKPDFVFAELGDNYAVPLQIYSRHVPLMGTVHYLPKSGLEATYEQQVSLTGGLGSYLDGMAFKVELEQPMSRTDLDLENSGWVQSDNVQYKATINIDLQPGEEEILADFKRRARYELRRAQREGVQIKEVEPTPEKLSLLYKFMAVTSDRSGCYLRSAAYMHKSWNSFIEQGQGRLFAAYYGHDLLAMSFVVHIGDKAWYKDSGSMRHRNDLGASRLLQWEIMRALKADGCKSYDLVGVPPRSRLGDHPMDGLYRFKSGFNKEVTEYLPSYTLPLKKRFWIWRLIEPFYIKAHNKLAKDFWY